MKQKEGVVEILGRLAKKKKVKERLLSSKE
jgi:hypothetical protein